MRGPKPKPTYLKIVAGNPGHRPLNAKEPKPAGNLEAPPIWLTESQQAGWRYAIEHSPHGLLKRLDSALLVIWVVAEDTHRQAAERLAKHGLLVKAPNTGLAIQSPYLPIVNRQADIMMKAAGDLGFSPASRTRIQVNEEVVSSKFDNLGA